MKIIAERSLKTNVRRCGFQEMDNMAHAIVEESLKNFVAKTLQRAQKASSKEGKQVVEEKHIQGVFQGRKAHQSGGAETTLPLEYFGVNSKNYFQDAPQGANMQVTGSTVRPAFLVSNPSFKGGASHEFKVSSASVKGIVAKQGVQVRQAAQKLMQQKFEESFEQVLSKVAKKFGKTELQGSQLQEVLNQKKFQKLFKH